MGLVMTARAPEELLASRWLLGTREPVKQWLIRWTGQTAANATWEAAIWVQTQFPNSSLEDKTLGKGGVMIENVDSMRGDLASGKDRGADLDINNSG
jgi:hypothetical protein